MAKDNSVIVLHIHEFATGRWGRMQVDCVEGAGEKVIDQMVSGLRDAGITAKSVIGTADLGHVARTILAANGGLVETPANCRMPVGAGFVLTGTPPPGGWAPRAGCALAGPGSDHGHGTGRR